MERSLARSICAAAEAGKDAVLELILPPVCRLCNQPVGRRDDFCRACATALTWSQRQMERACPRCGFPQPATVAGRSAEGDAADGGTTADALPAETLSRPGGIPCVHCRRCQFLFDAVAALWIYQGRVCEAVVAAKYSHQAALADALGRRLADRVEPLLGGDLPDWVTHVPSHVTRQLQRGGNGAQVLAQAVARRIQRPCGPLLRTKRRIAKQAWLGDAERVENVRDAFSLRNRYALPRTPRIAGRHILVVDDVLTTGATANEVARVLREGGARRVSLAVVARAVRSS